MVQAVSLLAFCLGFAQGGQKHRGKQGYNRDDNQQFDQGESVKPGRGGDGLVPVNYCFAGTLPSPPRDAGLLESILPIHCFLRKLPRQVDSAPLQNLCCPLQFKSGRLGNNALFRGESVLHDRDTSRSLGANDDEVALQPRPPKYCEGH